MTFDPEKGDATLRTRGLDVLDCVDVFAGPTVNFEDVRFEYGETRIVTIGLLRGRMVIVVWTPRGEAHHVISMRKANDREKERYDSHLR